MSITANFGKPIKITNQQPSTVTGDKNHTQDSLCTVFFLLLLLLFFNAKV
jgi:hypothetical protein